MENLYSYKGAYPYPLPSDMSNYDINDFVLVSEKPTIEKNQVLEWNGTNWVVRNANYAEIDIKWQEVRNLRDSLLANTDIQILKYLEKNLTVPTGLANYRQALRDLPQIETNPFDIKWPELVI